MASIKLISPITNSLKGVYNRIPHCEVKKDSILNGVEYIGRKWTSPQQRVAMGVTAILMQPFIDYHNRHVDEKTREVSISRTIAKICVGTATGFAIRYGCIKSIKAFSKQLNYIPQNASGFTKKLQTFFTPSNLDAKNVDAVEQYRNAMGTIISLCIMSVTNFLIDAPLTKLMTNALIKYRQEKGDKK